MVVLVLQSFLTVSVCFLCASSILQVSPVCCMCTSLPQLCVFQLCVFQYHAYKLLAPTQKIMPEAVIVYSLDLMETYHSVSISSSTVQWLFVPVLFQPVSGVTIKTVLKLSVCILSVQVPLQRHWLVNLLIYCEGTGVLSKLPTHLQPPSSIIV